MPIKAKLGASGTSRTVIIPAKILQYFEELHGPVEEVILEEVPNGVQITFVPTKESAPASAP